MIARRFLLATVTLLFGPCLLAGAKFCNFPHKHSIILAGAEGKELAFQCSRIGVPGVCSIWIPNSKQIAELEFSLCSYLKATYPIVYKRLKMTYFQFVGYNLPDRQIIYVNAFPEVAFMDSTVKSRDLWKTKAISACDGGTSFWGIEYNPNTKTFANIAFNGGG